ncbi:hypothetical protein R6Q59_023744 [Mikania micrantha]
MILLLSRLGFTHHHHRHHLSSEVNIASLQAFRSLVAENLNQALQSLILGSEFFSLTWIHRCFRMIPIINNAFAKTMVDIGYPMSRWEAGSIDDYLDYTINMLELLNSISSSISHVNQARLSLTRALSLIESSPALAVDRIREIKMHDSIKKCKTSGISDRILDRNRNENEWIFHEAMMVLRSTGFWVCGVVLSGLKSHVDPIMGVMTNMVAMDSSLMTLDSIFRKKFMEERGVLKEVEAVNESVRLIVSSGIGDSNDEMELKRRLKVVENGLTGLKDEEECVFGSVMAARNEVLEMLRRN